LGDEVNPTACRLKVAGWKGVTFAPTKSHISISSHQAGSQIEKRGEIAPNLLAQLFDDQLSDFIRVHLGHRSRKSRHNTGRISGVGLTLELQYEAKGDLWHRSALSGDFAHYPIKIDRFHRQTRTTMQAGREIISDTRSEPTNREIPSVIQRVHTAVVHPRALDFISPHHMDARPHCHRVESSGKSPLPCLPHSNRSFFAYVIQQHELYLVFIIKSILNYQTLDFCFFLCYTDIISEK